MSRGGSRGGSHEKAARRMDGDELTAVITLGLQGIAKATRKGGALAAYPKTPEGLQAFVRDSYSYLQYVQEVNSGAASAGGEGGLKLIPDVESWAAYMGVTREAIGKYEATRGSEWREAIQQIKGVITACKKQLALQGKIPPVLAIFDLTNNSGYVNSSEFRLQAPTQAEQKRITSEEWETCIDASPDPPRLTDAAAEESSDNLD